MTTRARVTKPFGGYVLTMLRVPALVAAIVFLGMAPPAGATVTLGALDPNPPGPDAGHPPAPDGSDYHGCGTTGGVYVPSQGSGGRTGARPRPETVVPAGGGVLTSWTVADEPAGNVFRLAVTRFTPDGVVIVARSAPETIQETDAKVTFSTHIPVAAGDQIALDWADHPWGTDIAEDCYYWTGDANDFVYIVGDYVADGQQSPWMTGYGYGWRRVNLQATLDTGDAGGGGGSSDPDPQQPAAPASSSPSPSGSASPSQPPPMRGVKPRRCTKRKAHHHRRCRPRRR
jgi:hypothetical protein